MDLSTLVSRWSQTFSLIGQLHWTMDPMAILERPRHVGRPRRSSSYGTRDPTLHPGRSPSTASKVTSSSSKGDGCREVIVTHFKGVGVDTIPVIREQERSSSVVPVDAFGKPSTLKLETQACVIELLPEWVFGNAVEIALVARCKAGSYKRRAGIDGDLRHLRQY